MTEKIQSAEEFVQSCDIFHAHSELPSLVEARDRAIREATIRGCATAVKGARKHECSSCSLEDHEREWIAGHNEGLAIANHAILALLDEKKGETDVSSA